MSFGFSVGDFVACILLIKNVAQALDSSSGSTAEVKAVVERLDSLQLAIISSEVVYQQCSGVGAGFEDVTKTMVCHFRTLCLTDTRSSTIWASEQGKEIRSLDFELLALKCILLLIALVSFSKVIFTSKVVMMFRL